MAVEYPKSIIKSVFLLIGADSRANQGANQQASGASGKQSANSGTAKNANQHTIVYVGFDDLFGGLPYSCFAS